MKLLFFLMASFFMYYYVAMADTIYRYPTYNVCVHIYYRADDMYVINYCNIRLFSVIYVLVE